MEAEYTEEDRAELVALVFDGLYESHHRRLAELVRDPIFDQREGLDMVEAGRLSYERIRHVHRALGPARDVAADPWTLFAVGEWSCLLDSTTLPLSAVHYNLCVGTILRFGAGRPELKPYLDELDDMSAVGMFAATEIGFGNNVSALETEAVYDQATDTFVLNTPSPRAQKFMPYCGITDIPKIAVVLARLVVDGRDQGVFPFLVRITDADGPCPGVVTHRCPDKPGLALDNGVTWFDHVRLPRANLLSGDFGELSADGVFISPLSRRGRFLRSFDRVHAGRISLAAALVAASRAAVYLAVRYSWRRETAAPGRGTVQVMSLRSQQVALLGALSRVYAMTVFLNEVKRDYVRGEAPEGLHRKIAIAKALSSWEMTGVITVCRERVGAQGVFSVNRIADYVAMAQGVVTAEGDNLPLLLTVAGELLAPRGAGATRPDPDGQSLLDGRFVMDLFSYKDETLRRETRQRMDRAPFSSAWNDNMNRVLDMAEAYGTHLVLRSFWQAVDGVESGALRTPLRLLASLYGLLHLRDDAGWYLARGCVTAEQVIALPDLVDTVCEQLAGSSHLLVDGFNLSPELLRAPIAQDDPVAAVDRYVRSIRR
ncbi:acyl-coenzyme A oxidase [Actinophytocola oryzae]|uniref:Acyl-coenzyme A oxidase n=2 Tax=Actinophytocola oryzae TaxID=502181 RepID=A0A4R7UVB3_9PSEU|nr:acyl-coenzyme A oxidase [Actinophytocola oryzae]